MESQLIKLYSSDITVKYYPYYYHSIFLSYRDSRHELAHVCMKICCEHTQLITKVLFYYKLAQQVTS